MMKEKIIGMLSCICVLLLACSEQEDNESLINNAIMGRETVDVRFSLSSLTEVLAQGNTDYRPMSATRAETGDIKAIITNEYKCVVIKEIGTKWYVDTVAQRNLLDNLYGWDKIPVKDKPTFKDLHLTLRPGHYRLLVVLNPQAAQWNPGLVPGAVVKEGEGKPVYAYTYNYQMSNSYPNRGKREVTAEIFVGTAEFVVEKTTDLHSNPVNGNTNIAFARKVMQMRFLAKNHSSDGLNFENTQHVVHATLKATDPNFFFTDGVDCWGDAYYNPDKPTTKVEICSCLAPAWMTGLNKEQYKTIDPDVTVYSPFVFTDEKMSVPYKLDNIRILGQAGGFTYSYREPITDLVLKNNTIQQFVFQTTPDAKWEGTQINVTLEYLKEESAEKLFDTYYECNLPR